MSCGNSIIHKSISERKMTLRPKEKVHIAICEYDPPFKDGRVSRVKCLGEYLSENNCQVTIYSFGPETKTFSSPQGDLVQIKYPGLALLEKASGGESKVKSALIDLIKKMSRLVFPDRYIFGIYRLSREISKRSTCADTLIVSAPQFSILLLLLFNISKKVSFIDYRDLWSGNPIFTSVVTKRLAAFIEALAIKRCNGLLVTTEEASMYMRKFKKEVITMYNGVPLRDKELVGALRRNRIRGVKKIIKYFGSLGNKRDCKNFLRACSKSKGLEIKLYGNIDSEHKAINPGFYHGFVDKKAMYEESLDSDMIMIVILKEEHAEYAIPGKIYEAMITGVPVLIYCPSNALALKYLQENEYSYYHIDSDLDCTQEKIQRHLSIIESKDFRVSNPADVRVRVREDEYKKLLSAIEIHA